MFNILKGCFSKSNVGLVITKKHLIGESWVSALTSYLVSSICKEYSPIYIHNQLDYNVLKNNIDIVISFEPGWAAPYIKYDLNCHKKKMVFLSDPHSKTKWFYEYFTANNFDYVLSYYYNPFFYHFPDFDRCKFIHFPWAFPDQFISQKINMKKEEIVIFGGRNSDAYDVRNWCRNQENVMSFSNSGVENKVMSDIEYFEWLKTFYAVVAAGSSNPIYDLVTPKYFEIPATGSLLIAQQCKDLEILGFTDGNSVIFTKNTFNEKVAKVLADKSSYNDIQLNGLLLMKSKHLVSHRISLLNEIINY